MIRRKIAIWATTVVIAAGTGYAQDTDARLNELERRIDQLTAELERERLGDIFIPASESHYGLGPAASKIYQKSSGLSLGGYGEIIYQYFDSDKSSQADIARAVIYVGNKFNERWVFNSEIEFEHASTKDGGYAAVEFAYIDYLWRPEMNFRFGLMLMPMGFMNEYHEPTTFFGALRPNVERYIVPSTWRETGVGVFGELGDVTYKAMFVNGFRGEKFSPEGIRSGRQGGSKSLADDFGGVISLEWQATPGLMLGAAGYYGDAGQDLPISVSTKIGEIHAEWRWRGLTVRGLAARAEVSNVAELNRLRSMTDEGPLPDNEIDSVGKTLTGWYVEAGYNVLNEFKIGPSLSPFVRYEKYNTQDRVPAGFTASGKYDVEVTTVGLNFKPIDEVVFKAEYQFYDRADGSDVDQFNLAMGYIF